MGPFSPEEDRRRGVPSLWPQWLGGEGPQGDCPLSRWGGSWACGQALGEGLESRCDEQRQRILEVRAGPRLSRGRRWGGARNLEEQLKGFGGGRAVGHLVERPPVHPALSLHPLREKSPDLLHGLSGPAGED